MQVFLLISPHFCIVIFRIRHNNQKMTGDGMNTESIKSLFSSIQNDTNVFLSSQVCKKELENCICKIKSIAATIADDEGGRWLRENATMMTEALASVQFCNVSIQKKFVEAARLLISASDFDCDGKELLSFFETLTNIYTPTEKELADIRSLLFFVLSQKIVDAAKSEHSLLPRYITVFHKLKAIDFDQLIQRFSPIERILRYDPAGIWQKMTKTTQGLYKSKLLQKAKKEKIKPEQLAVSILEKAKNKDRHVGFYLFNDKRKGRPIYFAFILFLGLLVEFAVSFDSPLLTWLVSLPLYFFVKRLTEFIVSLLIKPEPLPAIRIDQVDEKAKTCVVITSLITSKRDVDRLCNKLFQYRNNNSASEDKIYYGLLCDLKESDREFEKTDAEITDYLKEKIESIPEKHFFAAVRPRVYHESEEKWVGWERKRGAVDQLISYLAGEKSDHIKFFGSKNEIIGCRFLITLDADTSLGIGQAKRLIGIALHPLNQPVIAKKKGRLQVVSGYGILQPKILPSLLEPITTPFGKIYGNGSGNVAYSTASYDHMQHFYGEGNFCGKGLIDVLAYKRVMCGVLPEQMILSHDMPEGALMRCALVSEEHFSDSNPQTTESYYKRQHRWIRGDVQNLKIYHLINFHRKLFSFENLLGYFVPISELLLLISSGFIGKKQGIACTLLVLLFHCADLLTTALSILVSGNVSLIGRRFVTRIRNLILNGLYQFVLSLSALTFEAHLFADAIIRSLYRMFVSKKKLLEWQVYSSFSKGNVNLKFYLPSILLAVISCLLVTNIFQILIFILCLFFPILSHLISTPYRKSRGFNQKEKDFLFKKAKNEFLFFQNCVNENTNYLPPDNIQFAPVEKIAMRTSPTNVGLYLASLVAAKKMALISKNEMLFRLKNAMDSLDKMERWNGHLYNWYDLSTLKVIGSRFVSTVDSGNYVCCLIVVKEALNEMNDKTPEHYDLLLRIANEIKRISFLPLYNTDRNLLRVGIDTEAEKQSSSDYDLYMSEARTTSFLYVALGQLPVSHWSTLGRPLFSFRGRVGVGSWSGTTFEYFMPILFLPIIENSMEDESLDFALYCQKKHHSFATEKQKVFGISESGYSLTDSQENYQYKAFGVPYLSLHPNSHQSRIISPYSSFLMLAKKDRDIIENLRNLSKIGMEGKFGYYEACEFFSRFIGDYRIIYSYMSHHKGMSFLALTNALLDNVIQKWFLSYDSLNDKKELLAERFPMEGTVTKKKAAKEIIRSAESEIKKKIFSVSLGREEACHITDGKLGMIFYSNGDNRFLFHGEDLFLSKGIKVDIYFGEEKIQLQTEQNASVIFEQDGVTFSYKLRKSLILIAFKPIAGKSAFLIHAVIQGYPGPCKIEIRFDAMLEKSSVYKAHPAFQNLSLEATCRSDHLWIRRRGVEEHRYLHVFSSAPIKTAVQEKCYEASFENRMLLSPNVAIQSFFESGESINAVYAFAPDKREMTTNPLEYLDGSFDLLKEVRLQHQNKLLNAERDCHFNKKRRALESRILCSDLDTRNFFFLQKLNSYKIDSLWRHGISGDHPILLCFSEDSSDSLETAADLMCILKKMKRSGIGYDLVILQKKSKEYFDPLRDRITETISRNECEYLIGKHPGIHVIPYENENELELFIRCATFIFGAEDQCPITVENQEINIHQTTYPSSESIREVGSLESGDFVMNKNKFYPDVPFSQVISNQVTGFVCNQSSLGFTWHRNAGLNRLSAWDNLPKKDDGEKIYYLYKGKAYDLLQMADTVRFKRHFAIYQGVFEGKKYEICATASAKIAGKLMLVQMENFEEGELIFSFVPTLGAFPKGNVLISSKENMLFLRPVISGEYDGSAYFYSDHPIMETFRFGDRLCIKTKVRKKNLLALGGFSTDLHAEYIGNTLSTCSFETLLSDEKGFSDLFLQKKLSFEEAWIQYQAIFCRFFGRTGQYQSSGAYGFRDQLQDCLVFLDVAPEFTMRHILRAAAHQFKEGDVEHWWHQIAKTRGCHPGIRSRCSDDYLWLLYVTGEYILKTNDLNILDMKVPFLKAPSLQEAQDECYLIPELGESASLLEHLKRSVLLFVSRGLGPHQLPFIGSGDWNDGMNRVDGESVWLGAFGSVCLKRILPYLDDETAAFAKEFLDQMSVGIQNSFNGCWFVRVYRKNGSVLGNDVTVENECSIDLITQAFTAFYQLAFHTLENETVKKALECAYDLLYDSNSSTTKLFTRPFVKTEPTPGYIQRYCAGARENGGQYTHAAVWFALALLKFGEKTNDKELIKKGLEIGKSLNPFQNLEFKKYKRYQREPYVLCGDIFSAPGIRGHGGWSWYTGAAGWYLRLKKEMEKYKSP